jgi:hypothetical protein
VGGISFLKKYINGFFSSSSIYYAHVIYNTRDLERKKMLWEDSNILLGMTRKSPAATV